MLDAVEINAERRVNGGSGGGGSGQSGQRSKGIFGWQAPSKANIERRKDASPVPHPDWSTAEPENHLYQK